MDGLLCMGSRHLARCYGCSARFCIRLHAGRLLSGTLQILLLPDAADISTIWQGGAAAMLKDAEARIVDLLRSNLR